MRKFFLNLDLGILFPALFLISLGTLILSSVAPKLFPQQFLYIAIALFIYFVSLLLDEEILKAFSPVFFSAALFLLVATLFLGRMSHGAVRWIQIGTFSLQSSEIAKPLFIIFFSKFLEKSNPGKFALALILLFIFLLLVLKQPDLGSTITIILAFVGVLLGVGFSVKRFILISVFLLPLLPLIYNTLAPYQKARIVSFLNPALDAQGIGYSSIQSVIAVGSGRLFGRGLGQGSQAQLSFLPESHTDFVFASFSEEFGFVGVMLLLISFFLLFYRVIKIFRKVDSVFAKGIVGGSFLYLFSQTAINLGMNIGILPVTGIPLPLVSSGGSSLVSVMFTLGIVNCVEKSRIDSREK